MLCFKRLQKGYKEIIKGMYENENLYVCAKAYFVLPDYEVKKKGYVMENMEVGIMEEKISLDKERITVPELLFNPCDIGL